MNFRIAWLGLSLAALPALATNYNVHEELHFTIGTNTAASLETYLVGGAASSGRVHTLHAHRGGNVTTLAMVDTPPGNSKRPGRTYTLDTALSGSKYAYAKTVSDGSEGSVLDLTGGTFDTIVGTPDCGTSSPGCTQVVWYPMGPPGSPCFSTNASKAEGSSVQSSSPSCSQKSYGFNNTTRTLSYVDGT